MLKLVDRYILKQILVTLLFTLVSLCVIFIIVNFMERMDSFMDSKVTTQIIIKYYLVYLPEILKIITPVSILISCLFTIGKLSNNNEITAMKSGGLGLYRLIIPIAFVGLLLSFGQYYFNGWVVPSANAEKERISYVYLNRGNSGSPISNLAFRDTPKRNVLMQHYEPNTKKGYKVSIENFETEMIYDEFDSEIKSKNLTVGKLEETVKEKSENDKKFEKLTEKIEAKTISWNEKNQNWILEDAIVRTFIHSENNLVYSRNIPANSKNISENLAKSAKKFEISTKKLEKMPIKLNIHHKQLEKLNKKANEMNFDEMKDYISLLNAGGKDIRKMEIEYHSARALPLANFIVILFAVSFASVKKRGGLAVQIAAAMIIAFTYLIFFEVSKPLGLSMNLSPIFVGWIANILFIFCGIISIIKTRT